MTMCIVTHEMGFARDVGDRVWFSGGWPYSRGRAAGPAVFQAGGPAHAAFPGAHHRGRQIVGRPSSVRLDQAFLAALALAGALAFAAGFALARIFFGGAASPLSA